MIGSHDSFTYLTPSNKWINLIRRFWRCQDKSITEQYKLGVRFFDIRVFRDEVDGKKVWRVAHGPAELTRIFISIRAICNYFTVTLKDCKFRIWLEKGSDEDWEEFKHEAEPLIDEFDGFIQSYRKSNYELLFQKKTYPVIDYYACKMEKVSNLLKGLYTNPIKSWAKKHNPEITQEMIDDPDTCYLMDYV